MPIMKSLRSFRLASTTGHVMQIKAGDNNVHPDLVPEAMQAGLVPADAADAPVFEDLARAKVDFTGEVRKSMIFLAIKTLAEENDVQKFDGGGTPKASVVSDMLGLSVVKRELNDVYQLYLTAKASGEEYQLHPNAPNILRVLEAGSYAELFELGKEFGVTEKAMEGLSVKDTRRLVLVKLNGNAAG